MADLALEILRRNARFRAWRARGVPVEGGWEPPARPVVNGSAVWDVLEREQGMCSPCSGEGKFQEDHPDGTQTFPTCEACGGTGKRPGGPERSTYLTLICTAHGIRFGRSAWIPIGDAARQLEEVERKHVAAHCRCLAPLLGPDPEEVTALAALELLALEVSP